MHTFFIIFLILLIFYVFPISDHLIRPILSIIVDISSFVISILLSHFLTHLFFVFGVLIFYTVIDFITLNVNKFISRYLLLLNLFSLISLLSSLIDYDHESDQLLIGNSHASFRHHNNSILDICVSVNHIFFSSNHQ